MLVAHIKSLIKIYMNYDNENDNTIVKQKDEIIMKLLIHSHQL